jgi:hypothetical protein
VYHTGGTTGFVTSVTLVPSENLGIIIFTNSDYNEFYEAFKWSILDAYFGLPIGNYSAWWKPCFDQRQQKKELQIKTIRDSVNLKLTGARELKEYTGTYTHPVYGNIYIALKKDYLLVTFEHHPSLTATLERISGDRFLVTYNQPLFGTDVSEFQCKENGNKKLPLKIADMIEHGIYIFDFKTR